LSFWGTQVRLPVKPANQSDADGNLKRNGDQGEDGSLP
jgi:hypothetical protein